MGYAITLDIGGTKIAAALMNEQYELLHRAEVASNNSDREAMFAEVVTCVNKVLEASAVEASELLGIGVGVPGKVDRENGIAVFQNNLPWENFPLASRLKEHFGVEGVVVDNDVYMATYAEWVNHGADAKETFVYYTISTGISAAIINHSEFVMGNGFAGEVGLLPVQTGQGVDAFSTVEKIASGPAITKQFAKDSLTTKEIIEGYKAGDAHVSGVVSQMIATIALGTYSIGTILDPQKIVFGGGVMNHQPFLLDEIKAQMKKFLIPAQAHMLDNLFLSKSKGDAGLVGAGMRVFRDT